MEQDVTQLARWWRSSFRRNSTCKVGWLDALCFLFFLFFLCIICLYFLLVGEYYVFQLQFVLAWI